MIKFFITLITKTGKIRKVCRNDNTEEEALESLRKSFGNDFEILEVKRHDE